MTFCSRWLRQELRVSLGWSFAIALALAASSPAYAAVGSLADVNQTGEVAERTLDEDEMRHRVLAWSLERSPNLALYLRAIAVWQQANTAGDWLDRTLATVATNDSQVRQYASNHTTDDETSLAEAMTVVSEVTDSFASAQARLHLARRMVHAQQLDEALAALAPVDSVQALDPAAVWFYRAVACARLLRKNEGLEALDRLASVAGAPLRFRALIPLVRADLEPLEEASLDHVARRMADIQRRLGLGRAGEQTREVEAGVVASLDKLIEEMEQQQQSSSSSSGGSGSGDNQSGGKPAEESRIMGGSGAGSVEKRSLGSRSGWGDLPPRQRQDALQQVGQGFPAHYRDVIEQYFQDLATEGSADTSDFIAGDSLPPSDEQPTDESPSDQPTDEPPSDSSPEGP